MIDQSLSLAIMKPPREKASHLTDLSHGSRVISRIFMLMICVTTTQVEAQKLTQLPLLTPPKLFSGDTKNSESLSAADTTKVSPSSTVPKKSIQEDAETSPLQNPQSDDLLPSPEPLTAAEVRLAFDRGRNAYLYGSYKETVESLSPLLVPTVLIADPQMLTLAYEYLGLAYFYLGNNAEAISCFKNLIYFSPDHRLDPVRVPPNAVSLYNKLHTELQAELQERQEALARQAELEEERRLRKNRQQVILEQQVNQKLVALIPFGAGQFQNRETGLGYFFLSSELIAVGLSSGFFWGVESLRQSDGRFMKRDYLYAQQLQRAHLISGGVALGLMVSGALLALWRYKDRHDLGNYLDLNSRDQDESSGSEDIQQLSPAEIKR